MNPLKFFDNTTDGSTLIIWLSSVIIERIYPTGIHITISSIYSHTFCLHYFSDVLL